MRCVSFAIIQNGSILLQHRDDYKNIKYPNYWAITSGGVKENELLIDALFREFNEEIIVDQDNILISFSFIGAVENEWNYYEYVFLTIVPSKFSIKCIEGKESGFYKLEDIMNNSKLVPPHHKKIIEMIQDYLNLSYNELKEEKIMSNSVNNYISLKRLGTEKRPQEYQDLGKGYIVKKGNALTALYHNGDPVRCLAYIEFEPGKTRGDHYHNKKIENMCVVKGSIKAKYMLPDNTKEVMEINLTAGDIVRILPGCAHSYMSDEGAIALEYSPQKFEISDTIDIDFEW